MPGIGRRRIALRQGEGSVFFGVGPLDWTRRFTYNRNTVVSLRPTSLRVNNVPQQGIVVETEGTELVFWLHPETRRQEIHRRPADESRGRDQVNA